MRPAVRWLLRILVAAAALTVGIAIVGRRMPGVDEVTLALRSGDTRWLVLAVGVPLFVFAFFLLRNAFARRSGGYTMR